MIFFLFTVTDRPPRLSFLDLSSAHVSFSLDLLPFFSTVLRSLVCRLSSAYVVYLRSVMHPT